MINWRSIKDVGYPKDQYKKYLVSDGKDISTSEISGKKWTGDDNTYEDNSCCSGPRSFYMIPTHWCPLDEINLPTEA